MVILVVSHTFGNCKLQELVWPLHLINVEGGKGVLGNIADHIVACSLINIWRCWQKLGTHFEKWKNKSKYCWKFTASRFKEFFHCTLSSGRYNIHIKYNFPPFLSNWNEISCLRTMDFVGTGLSKNHTIYCAEEPQMIKSGCFK